MAGRRSATSPFVLLEGPRTVAEALDAGIDLETVIVPESGSDRPEVTELTVLLGDDVEHLVVRDKVFERLAPSVTPQPMLAFARRPEAELPTRLSERDVVLVLVGVADPGNVGTLIRVADAVAVRCVVTLGGADPWGDKAVRASAGSILRTPVVSGSDPAATLSALRSAGARVVGADVRAGSAHDQGALTPPVAIVLGSEAHGLPPEFGDLVDERVHIEMVGRAESLNVAMAGTLLAFETRRSR